MSSRTMGGRMILACTAIVITMASAMGMGPVEDVDRLVDALHTRKIPGVPQRTFQDDLANMPPPVPAPRLQNVTDEARARPAALLAAFAPTVDPASGEAAAYLETLALAFEENGRYAEALPLFAKALEIQRELDAAPFRLSLSAQHVLRVATRTTDGWATQDDALAVFVEIETPRRINADPLVVGVVGGRPIFEHEVFDEIGPELRETSERRQRRRVILSMLEGVVLHELLLAESLRGLDVSFDDLDASTAEIRQHRISQFDGDEAKAEQATRAENTTLDAWAHETVEQAIINRFLAQELRDDVHVTSDEIDALYRRRSDEFNPPTRGVYGRIILPGTGDAVRERAERVAGRLSLGDDFVAVATDEGSRSVWTTLELDENGLPPSVKPSVRTHFTGLDDVGDIVGPFELNEGTWWISLLEIERPAQRSISDPTVRRELERELRQQRTTERQIGLIEDLLKDQVVRYELQTMVRELIARADDRH